MIKRLLICELINSVCPSYILIKEVKVNSDKAFSICYVFFCFYRALILSSVPVA